MVGGSWARDPDISAPESPYLAFVVGLHVATALTLLIYFRQDWVRLMRGLVTSIVRREVAAPDQRLAWLLVLATIPVGIAGLALEHLFRTTLSRPSPTAAFLMLNGVVLLVGEHLRSRADHREAARSASATTSSGPTSRRVGGPLDATQPIRADEPPTEVLRLDGRWPRTAGCPGWSGLCWSAAPISRRCCPVSPARAARSSPD